MKLLLTVLTIIILSASGLKAQSTNCEKFKNGTFRLTFDGQISVIKRAGVNQLEFLNGETTPMTFAVNWIDGCTYTLKPKADFFKKFPDVPKDALLTVKIIATTENSYTQTSTSNFSEQVLTCEMVKMD